MRNKGRVRESVGGGQLWMGWSEASTAVYNTVAQSITSDRTSQLGFTARSQRGRFLASISNKKLTGFTNRHVKWGLEKMQTFLNITPEQKSGSVFTNETGLELRLTIVERWIYKGNWLIRRPKIGLKGVFSKDTEWVSGEYWLCILQTLFPFLPRHTAATLCLFASREDCD